MYSFEINNKEYYVNCETWDEIKIETFIELNKICYKDKDIVDYFRAVQESKEVTDSTEFYIKTLPFFKAKVLKILSDIPHEIIDTFNPDDLSLLYENCHSIVLSAIDGLDYLGELTEAKYFECENEKYYYPVTDTTLSTEKFLANEQAKPYAEVADLQLAANGIQEDKYDNIPLIVAILCRKEKEVYNEANTLERVEKFELLPMSIYWQVFFYLVQRNQQYQKLLVNVLETQEVPNLRVVKSLQKQSTTT